MFGGGISLTPPAPFPIKNPVRSAVLGRERQRVRFERTGEVAAASDKGGGGGSGHLGRSSLGLEEQGKSHPASKRKGSGG